MGQTLLPADVSTTLKPAEEPEPYAAFGEKRRREDEERAEADSVFAKLKTLKGPEDEDEEG